MHWESTALSARTARADIERILRSSSIPVMVQPNAGLPVFSGGEAGYDVTDEEFADASKDLWKKSLDRRRVLRNGSG
jgi:methionine synthase I (cobalamin-dependent)